MVKTYRPWHEVDTLRRLTGFHDESRCAGQVCVIHNPTDHHLRHLPLIWRHDRRIFERLCPHGVGHPDPDHLPHWEAVGWESNAVHGCDGCCEEATLNPDLTLPRDAWWMAVRYGRGRATHADYTARCILRAVWPHLNAGERDLERRELHEFLRLSVASTPGESAAHWRLLYEAMDGDTLPPELPGTPVFDDWEAYR